MVKGRGKEWKVVEGEWEVKGRLREVGERDVEG